MGFRCPEFTGLFFKVLLDKACSSVTIVNNSAPKFTKTDHMLKGASQRCADDMFNDYFLMTYKSICNQLSNILWIISYLSIINNHIFNHQWSHNQSSIITDAGASWDALSPFHDPHLPAGLWCHQPHGGMHPQVFLYFFYFTIWCHLPHEGVHP